MIKTNIIPGAIVIVLMSFQPCVVFGLAADTPSNYSEAIFWLPAKESPEESCPASVPNNYLLNSATMVPTLTPPANLTLSCVQDQQDNQAAIITWLDNYTVIEFCSGLIVTNNFSGTTINYCTGDDILVTWSATDDCGNTATAQATIVINVDNTPPSLTPPANLTLSCVQDQQDNQAAITDWLDNYTVSDGCDSEPTVSHNFSGTTINYCTGDDILVTWTATDDCGNSTTRQATIVVTQDAQVPTVTVPGPLVLDCGDINETTDPAAQILDWLALASAADNCDSEPGLTYDFNLSILNLCAPDMYTITVTWTATDDCGNSSTASSTITVVPDTQDPSITVPAPLVLDCGDIGETTDPSAQILDWLGSATVSDNCDTDPELTYDFNLSILNLCAPASYTITVTWTANDACNNASTATSTITVIPDTQDPFINVPAPLVLDCGDINETTDPSAQILDWLGSATVSDNCDTDPELTYDFNLSILNICAPAMYTITVTWTANDACNNVSTATSTITVIPDTQDPFITVPAPLVLACDEFNGSFGGTFEILDWLGSASVSDNCDTDPELVYDIDFSTLDQCTPGTYMISVLWTANDHCNNTSTASSTISVNICDPVSTLSIMCPLDIYQQNDIDWCQARIEPDTPVIYTCSDFVDASLVLTWTITGAGATDANGVPVTSGDGFVPALYFNVGISIIEYIVSGFDLSGNPVSDTCSFTITVVDKQKPELAGGFPLDEYVNCNAVPSPFPLTPDDFIDNCPGPLTVDFMEMSTQGANPAVCNYYTYEITRIWKVTDQSGNMRPFEQNIFVTDTTAPEFMVNDVLISCDMVDMAPGIIDTSDNCAANQYLTIISTDVSTQDPDMENCGHYTYIINRTWTVSDPCGNASTQLQVITVQDIEPPVIQCQDVIVELDENGEVILSGNEVLIDVMDNCAADEFLTVSVITLSGPLTCENLGTSLQTIMVTDPCGNAAFCEVNVTVVDLLAPTILCPAPQTFYLTGGECFEFLGAGNLPVIDDNCTATVMYSPSIEHGVPIGINIITATATDQSGNTASCNFEVTIVEYTPVTNVLACNDQVQVSLGPDCMADINADMLLEGDDYGCYDNFCLYIVDAEGDTLESPQFTLEHINQCFTVTIVDCANSNNSCWGTICVEEKINPEIICPADITVSCNQSIQTTITGVPEVLSCEGSVTMAFEDEITDNGDCGEPRVSIDRTWTVTDESGNVSTCLQHITVEKFNPDILAFPADIMAYSCYEVTENPDLLLPVNSGLPTLNGLPVFGDHYCEIFVGYWDETAIDANCPTNYTILRHWLVLDQCLPYQEGVNPVRHVQLIQVLDDVQPTIDCPDDIVVSTDFWYCYATVSLPTPQIYDACSELVSYTVQASSGNLIHFGGNAYSLTNLEPGTHSVTYVTKDQCNNIGYCFFTITVVDQVAPVANCDQHTIVALTNDGPNGVTLVPASVFDDGSYDNCGPVTFRARRMDSCIDFDWTTDGGCIDDTPNGLVNSRDQGTLHRPCVPFACCDVGTGPIMVELEVTDASGNVNYCMVEVEVQDKVSPFVECPPDIIVSCDFWFSIEEGTFADTEGNGNGNLDEDPLSAIFGNMYDAFQYNDDESVRGDVIINDPGNIDYNQPHFWGIEGWADDNCEVNLQVRVRVIDDCSGEDLPGNAPDGAVKLIERRFSASDGNEGIAPGTCTQRIWVVDFAPFYITDNTCNNSNSQDGVIWPCDVLLTTCPEDFGNTGEPIIFDDACSLIGMTYEDTRFDLVDSACFKILRKWEVIDWCQYNAQTGEGLWHYTQVIKVLDEDGPEFVEPCETQVLCLENDGVSLPDNNQSFLGEDNPLSSSCSVHLNLTRIVHETCSDIVGYDVKIYPFNGTEYILIKPTTTALVDENNNAVLSFDTRQSTNQSIRLNGLPYNSVSCGDYHRILWSVEDGCGNWSHCEYLFRLEDCKQPSPVCINGLSTVVMPIGGQVTVWAKDFNASSFDDCTPSEQLLYSFSGDSYQPSFTYNCDNVPAFNVELSTQIWVADGGTDDNCNGLLSWDERNKDYCTTTIVITDNNDVCGGAGSILAGEVLTEQTNAVGLVNVTLTSPGHIFPQYVTAQDGKFTFLTVPLGEDYMITPGRNDAHRNGVSTLDLVRIQKHLLGKEVFTSPYQYIAADVNNNANVSALDLIEIRKLILGLYDAFPENQSWRFVEKSSGITLSNPWLFNEDIEIIVLNSDSLLHNDFYAVKVGDVNNTAKANFNQPLPRQIRRVVPVDVVADQEPGLEEIIKVTFSIPAAFTGFQWTLETNHLEYLGLFEDNGMHMNESHIGQLVPGVITMSWNETPEDNSEQAGINWSFTLLFRKLNSGNVSEMLTMTSRITAAEAYMPTDEIVEPVLHFLRSEEVSGFALYQNEPNPWDGSTTIRFEIPEPGNATITILDVTGKVLLVREGLYKAGANTLQLQKQELNYSGLYYYRLDFDQQSATKKMVLVN